MNTVKVAPLKWNSENEGVIFSSPYGFENAYFITFPNTQTNESKHYELALIDSNGKCDETNTSIHISEEAAKEKAQELFTALVLKCLK